MDTHIIEAMDGPRVVGWFTRGAGAADGTHYRSALRCGEEANPHALSAMPCAVRYFRFTPESRH